MNVINVIAPYKWNGLYCFDDEDKGLVKEPFLSQATEFLEMLSNNAEKCLVTFSKEPFKGYEFSVNHLGNGDYYSEDLQHDLWLCPATLKYFETYPDNIYLKVNAL